MKNKNKILRIITSLDPKYGGPQNGILSSSVQLIKDGFKVDIATCDSKKINIKEHKNIKIINFKSFIGDKYRFSFGLFIWLYKNKKNYDFFLIHGLWQFNSLIARLLLRRRKYYVFTHGQLDPFFGLNLYKKIKKKIYWYLIERKNLANSKGILLTSKGEKLNLNNTFVDTFKIKKHIIRYGILQKNLNKKRCINSFNANFPFLCNKKFYLFLGRFNEKKGCEIIIESVIKLKKKFKSKILFAGPIENTNYFKNLKQLVKENNLENTIFFSDSLYEDKKWGAILKSKGMLLASHGENFGIAIAESLSQGKPVLITNKVNIYKNILNHNAGIVSSNTTSSFSKKLLQFENINIKKLNKMSKYASICFKENFDVSSNENSLGFLLKKELNKKELPIIKFENNFFDTIKILFNLIVKSIECLLRLNFYRSYLNKTSPLFELEPLISNLKNIETIIDVGSNKGQFSILARYHFPKAKILSFEPQKSILSIQQKNFSNDRNIKFYKLGLGNEKCNKKFYITNREDSSSFLDPEIINHKFYKVKKIENIKINKLDNMLNSNQIKKKVLIKLDVQGFELEVLKGSKKLLKVVDYIIAEISYQNIYKKQSITKDLIHFLKKNNFTRVKSTHVTKSKNKLFQADVLFRKVKK